MSGHCELSFPFWISMFPSSSVDLSFQCGPNILGREPSVWLAFDDLTESRVYRFRVPQTLQYGN